MQLDFRFRYSYLDIPVYSPCNLNIWVSEDFYMIMIIHQEQSTLPASATNIIGMQQKKQNWSYWIAGIFFFDNVYYIYFYYRPIAYFITHRHTHKGRGVPERYTLLQQKLTFLSVFRTNCKDLSTLPLLKLQHADTHTCLLQT